MNTRPDDRPKDTFSLYEIDLGLRQALKRFFKGERFLHYPPTGSLQVPASTVRHYIQQGVLPLGQSDADRDSLANVVAANLRDAIFDEIHQESDTRWWYVPHAPDCKIEFPTSDSDPGIRCSCSNARAGETIPDAEWQALLPSLELPPKEL